MNEQNYLRVGLWNFDMPVLFIFPKTTNYMSRPRTYNLSIWTRRNTGNVWLTMACSIAYTCPGLNVQHLMFLLLTQVLNMNPVVYM